MIFKRESKRMLKKQIAKLEKLGWTLDENNDLVVCFRKTEPVGNYVHELAIYHKRDVDTRKEKPAEIHRYQIASATDAFDVAVSLTAPEAWAAIGIAVAKGWRAMK